MTGRVIPCPFSLVLLHWRSGRSAHEPATIPLWTGEAEWSNNKAMAAASYKHPRQARIQPGSVADGGIPIAKLIGPLLKSVKLDEQCRLGILEEKWAEAVGKSLAAHTRPGTLVNKALTVYVDSSPWLSEIYRMQRELLGKVQNTFGSKTVQSVRLQLDPGGT